jgi:DNA-binding NarL/FixJ family response regulator
MLQARILIIEIEDELYNSLAEILEGYGYEPLRSWGRDDTMLMLQEDTCAMLIIGSHTGDDDRWELCTEIKDDDRWKNIPIMFLTSPEDIDERKRVLEAGAVDYLPVPFDKRDVFTRVQTHIYLRNIERRLGEQIRFTNILINNLPFGVMLIGDDGYITTLNDWLISTLGYGPSDNINHLDQVMLDRDIQTVIKVIDESKRDKGNLNKELECKIVSADQQLLDVKIILVSFNQEGKAYNIAIIEDMTLEKKKEQYHYFLIDSLKMLQEKTADYIDLLNLQDRNRVGGSDVADRDLSDLDRRIIRGIVEGNSNKEIAYKLDYSEIYIRKKLSELYKKFDVGSRYELANLFNR